MRTKALSLLLVTLLAACGSRAGSTAAEERHETENHTEQSAATASGEMRDGVEILSFHAKRRCPTCRAIEQLTREVVAEEFAARIDDGSLRLHVAGISEEPELAARYKVSWSSLLLCRRHNGSEQVVDLTRFAFANARKAPDRFRSELKARIEELLKE